MDSDWELTDGVGGKNYRLVEERGPKACERA